MSGKIIKLAITGVIARMPRKQKTPAASMNEFEANLRVHAVLAGIHPDDVEAYLLNDL